MKPALTQDEGVLVSRALGGDPQAQYGIYKKYVGAMFHTAIRMVGNREDAEDVTQEVFTKVFQGLDSFRGESTLGAWIKRVTVNTCLNFMRQRRKIFFEEINDKLNTTSEPEFDEKEWAFNIQNIHEAIKKLPDGCRMVFNLYMLEGYKHAEVAELLGITESTSKTQYKRAKRLIRELIL